MSVTKQTRALAAAVAAAFSRADLTPEEVNASTLRFNDLPWNWPALICSAEIENVPVSHYLDMPMDFRSQEALHTFWTTTLADLYKRRAHVIKHGTYRQLQRAAPRSRPGQRSICFAIPSGFPSQLSDTAGVEFSLEAAHTALHSFPITKLVSDGDNYYVVTSEGFVIGVKDGAPATSTDWDVPVSGMVQDFLTMPRGNTDYACLYDQIARCRSLIHEHKDRFKDFEGIDWALQALRKLSLGAYCPDLTNSRAVAAADESAIRARELAVRQAIELMRIPNIDDRRKVRGIEDLLVPLALGKSEFCAKVYNTNIPIPFAIRDAAVAKIMRFLTEYYESKVPQKYKHETLSSRL